MLNESNDEFTPINNVQVMVEGGFNLESPKEDWVGQAPARLPDILI